VETPPFLQAALEPPLRRSESTIIHELDAEARGLDAKFGAGHGFELGLALAEQASGDALERRIHVARMAHQLADAFGHIL